MTTFKEQAADAADGVGAAEPADAEEAATPGKLTLAEILEIFAGGRLPLRFTAYDGSSAGPPTHPSGWT